MTLIGPTAPARRRRCARSTASSHHARQGHRSAGGATSRASPAHEIVKLGIAQSSRGPAALPAHDRAREPRDRRLPAQRQPTASPRISIASSGSSRGSRSASRRRRGTLSGGEQQMCAIGRALMARPRLLLLDEPSMGLAPILVERIFEIIVEINRQGTTVLLVEQNALDGAVDREPRLRARDGPDRADGQCRRSSRRTTRCARCTSARRSVRRRGRRPRPRHATRAATRARRCSSGGTPGRRSMRRTRAARRARRGPGPTGRSHRRPHAGGTCCR